MADKKVFNFDQEGVAVTVPQQDSPDQSVSNSPSGNCRRWLENRVQFQPDRLVINIRSGR